MIFEQSIEINASATTVERCFTDLDLMRQWLNPALGCEAIGARSRFLINIPFLQPTLRSVVVGRSPGLVSWGFRMFAAKLTSADMRSQLRHLKQVAEREYLNSGD